jgi:hypothetical protein
MIPEIVVQGVGLAAFVVLLLVALFLIEVGRDYWKEANSQQQDR